MPRFCARNTHGEENPQRSSHKRGSNGSSGKVNIPVERSGETRRDRQLDTIRTQFMAEQDDGNGIDRATFKTRHSRGKGYKFWRDYAKANGINLPA